MPLKIRAMKIHWRNASAFLLTLVWLVVASPAWAAVFSVNSTADSGDLLAGDGLCATGASVTDPVLGVIDECTLRAAIEEANQSAARDRVEFTSPLIYTGLPRFAYFSPATPYPAIVNPIDIDGTSAPTYEPTTTPRVIIEGPGTGTGFDFQAPSANATLRGLTVGRFDVGVALHGTEGAWVDACSLGYHAPAGGSEVVVPNGTGLLVDTDATDSKIGIRVAGSSFVGTGNVVSGNGLGIKVDGNETSLIGNRIGTDRWGTRVETLAGVPLGNTTHGIEATAGLGLDIGAALPVADPSAPSGTSFLSRGNVISGNGEHGIEINELVVPRDGPGIMLVANRIGSDSTGTQDLGNGLSGIHVSAAQSDLVVGTDMTTANVISGNGDRGIVLEQSTAGAVSIIGNRVGVGRDDSTPIPNQGAGVFVAGADTLRIEANVIGHNEGIGLEVDILLGSQYAGRVEVIGNWIGVSPTSAELPNSGTGIDFNVPYGLIQGNTIGANLGYGIELQYNASDAVVIENWIGTDEDGIDLGNSAYGIYVRGLSHRISLGLPGAGNTIGWNGFAGIIMIHSYNDHEIVGNYIGTDVQDRSLPNRGHGIRLVSYAAGSGGPAIIGSGLATPADEFDARANWIGFNEDGAIVALDGTAAVIRGNRMKENGPLAIDLGEDLVTANDPGDADVGANGLQNHPELDEAGSSLDPITGELEITFSVPSDPSESAYPITVDLYLADEVSHQPLTYLGSASYLEAEANLDQTLRFLPETALPPGDHAIVALATNADSLTSEASPSIIVPEANSAIGLALGSLVATALGRRRPRGFVAIG